MVLLLRVFLIGLIIYLLTRSFFMYGRSDKDQEQVGNKSKKDKKISKDTGEFVDYEEVD